MMKKLALLALILVLSVSLNEYSATQISNGIPTSGTLFDILRNRSPVYPLEAQEGDTIEIIMRLINPTPGITLDNAAI